jgi:hypothetical protein
MIKTCKEEKMVETRKTPSDQVKRVKFLVDFDEKPDKPIDIVASAFDRNGTLLLSTPVKEGQVSIPQEIAKTSRLRLFFAPAQPEGEKPEITLAEMERTHAYEPVWELDPQNLSYQLLPIPKDLWKWWLKCKCRVRGKVVKPVVINNIVMDKPVCNARVHICEVDKLWILIPRLPDYLVLKLRDDLIQVLKHPPKLPDPDPEIFRWPPPLPDPPDLFPKPIPQQPTLPELKLQSAGSPLESDSLVEINPQPEPPSPWQRFAKTGLNVQAVGSALQPETPNTNTFEILSAETRLGLMAASVSVVRQTLAENYKLILPYLCLWPWFHPYFCICDEVAVLSTDHFGRFDTYITYPCFGDHPDLYFWVEYLIDGVWTTVYRPKFICCHTYWNYVCGTEVTIRVTDPRVPWCDYIPDLPGLMITITTIGNGVSMSEIVHTSGTSEGHTTAGEPFAGTLEMRMDLSRSNLIAKGITHYRWSYKRLTQGDASTSVTDTWHPMASPIYRHYKKLVLNPTPPPLLKPYYPTDQMGPDDAHPGEYLFRIQPGSPPAGGLEWSVLNEHVDLAYAYFNTGSLYESGGTVPAAGKYAVKLELFKSDGSLVNWKDPAAPVDVFVSSNSAPFIPPVGMTTNPVDPANLIKDSSGNVWGYQMVLYVDNSPCEAEIYDTWADNLANKAGPCGFIRFSNRSTSAAHLSFLARQEFKHAMFRFRTVKGSSGYIEDACAGWNTLTHAPIYVPVGVGPVNGFTRNSNSEFSKSVNVGTMLDANGFNCVEAAFGETLYVYATATNGYTRAYWLDAEATPKAFALAPMPPSSP